MPVYLSMRGRAVFYQRSSRSSGGFDAFVSAYIEVIQGIALTIWEGDAGKPNTNIFSVQTAPTPADRDLARTLFGEELSHRLSEATHFKSSPPASCGIEVTAFIAGKHAAELCGGIAFCTYECTDAGCSKK
jgi:hypothetical protein